MSTRSVLRWSALAGLLLLHSPVEARGNRLGLPRIHTTDIARRIDANQINMCATNVGSFAFNLSTGDAGLEYPKGSGITSIFAAGLWMGARVGGETRVVVAEYSQEFGPGAMSGGTFTDPSLPAYRVYKVARWSGDPQDSAHVDRVAPGPFEDPLVHDSWSEYMAGAVPFGAPWRLHRLPDLNTPAPDDSVDVPGPEVLGDQMLWTVYNDANPSNHYNNAGNSPPLGIEVQQFVWAFNQSGGLGRTVFMKFKIINKGGNSLEDAYVSLWSDPDLGGAAGFTDDLVGCDTTLDLGYVYNATNNDGGYGSSPPACGFVLLRGPATGSDTLRMTAFTKYINGTDPTANLDSYNHMQGLFADGSPIVDPTTGFETRFMHSGEPVSGMGWLDSNPADRRMMVSSGPFHMAPGDTQQVEYAIAIGQGSNRLASISDLKTLAAELKDLVPPPPPPTALNCPRDPDYWSVQCDPSEAELSSSAVDSIAAYVNQGSLLFDWLAPRNEFCAAITPAEPVDLRAQAKREFAALLANYGAGVLDIVPPGGSTIELQPQTPISCPGMAAVNIEGLVAIATPSISVRSADYLDLNPDHRRALEGLDWGGAGFGGGAATLWEFFGSSLDPLAHPDSFVTVEIRFSPTETQYAYRYLRLEQVDGSQPVIGRGYPYGGFRTVPFQAWDVRNNVQLDVAFVERTITDADGTILPPAQQPATFDSTWMPSSDPLDREYLIVISRPYGDAAKAELAIDGLPISGVMPGLYVLWSYLRTPDDVIDDGDAFEFVWSPYSGPGVDTRLLELEGEPLSDPSVEAAYAEIIACVGNVNRGIGLENPCDKVTPVLVSLVDAFAEPTGVTLAWQVSGTGLPVVLERRESHGDWAPVAILSADGTGMIRYLDRDVLPGNRYGYRLQFDSDGVVVTQGETWLDVPVRDALALAGFVPNPASRNPSVEFLLPSRDRARLELFDVQGRRMLTREVGQLGPGRHVISLEGAVQLAPGTYLITLTQRGQTTRRKGVVVR